MSTVNDRFSPDEYIIEAFKELRRLYGDHQNHIDDEIIGLTGKALHDIDGNKDACASACRLGDYRVYDGDKDVVYEHLTYEEGEITDLAAEAIVRRLCSGNIGVVELAHFNGWLDVFGFQRLTKRED